jgi:hypothetical protein
VCVDGEVRVVVRVSLAARASYQKAFGELKACGETLEHIVAQKIEEGRGFSISFYCH